MLNSMISPDARNMRSDFIPSSSLTISKVRLLERQSAEGFFFFLGERGGGGGFLLFCKKGFVKRNIFQKLPIF